MRGRDRKFFDEHAGAVSVRESGVDVDDGEAGVDEVDTADVGAGWEWVRRRFDQIESDEGAKHFFGALLTDRGHGNLRRLGSEYSDVVIGNK